MWRNLEENPNEGEDQNSQDLTKGPSVVTRLAGASATAAGPKGGPRVVDEEEEVETRRLKWRGRVFGRRTSEGSASGSEPTSSSWVERRGGSARGDSGGRCADPSKLPSLRPGELKETCT